MASATNGHQAPTERRHASKPSGESDIERKRRLAREYYHANKGRLAAEASKRYHAKKSGGKAVRVIPEGDNPPTVPKRPSKLDALICINRSLLFLGKGDADGAEIWARFAARIIEGKE